MIFWVLGATLHRQGVLRDNISMSSIVKSTSGFMSHRQQVKHRIGRTAHCNIQRHRIQERLAVAMLRAKHTFVSFPIIFISIFNNQPGSILKQLLAVCVVATIVPLPGRASPIASFRQFMELAVNIPEQHPQWDSMLFNLATSHRSRVVGRFNHRINQIQMLPFPPRLP